MLISNFLVAELRKFYVKNTLLSLLIVRSSRSQMFFKIDVLKNFTMVSGQACNLIKKRLQHRCFSVKFAKFSRTPDVSKTSSVRLQRNHFLSSKTFWRRLAKTSWRRLEDVFLEDMSWRVCKTSWRLTKCLLELSVSNKSKCVSNKSGISQIYIWRI